MYEILAIFLFALGGGFDGWRDYLGWADCGRSTVVPERLKILWGIINIPLDKWHILKTASYTCFALGAFVSGMTVHPWISALVGWVIVRPPVQNTVLFSKIYGKFKIRGW